MRVAVGLIFAVIACRSPEPPGTGSAATFWQELERHCGKAYAGRLVDAPPGDTTFAGQALVMQVRSCSPPRSGFPSTSGTIVLGPGF